METNPLIDMSSFGFDPTRFTNAPLQTHGWIRFSDPPARVFARLTDHQGMTEWMPLLKKVTVTHLHPLPAGESAVGTTRTLEFQGGMTLVERIVLWNPPLCYAYDTQGKGFPLQNYVGLMAVEPSKDGGGTFVFLEYFDVDGRLKNAVIPHGEVLSMRIVFHKLSPFMGGTDYAVNPIDAQV